MRSVIIINVTVIVIILTVVVTIIIVIMIMYRPPSLLCGVSCWGNLKRAQFRDDF